MATKSTQSNTFRTPIIIGDLIKCGEIEHIEENFLELDCNQLGYDYNIEVSVQGSLEPQLRAQFNLKGSISQTYLKCAPVNSKGEIQYDKVLSDLVGFYGDIKVIVQYSETNLKFNQNIGELEEYETIITEFMVCSGRYNKILKGYKLSSSEGLVSGRIYYQLYYQLYN